MSAIPNWYTLVFKHHVRIRSLAVFQCASHKHMNKLIEIFLHSKVKRNDFKRQMVSNWYLTEE